MDAPATAAQPTEQLDMGALPSASRHPHPGGPNPTSLSQRTLCRHPSKVGTVCVNRASTGLCGGYRATDIPTATSPAPRRALAIGIRNLRVHGVPLPCSRGLASRLRPALAHLSQEPS